MRKRNEEEDAEYWCPDLSGSPMKDRDGNEFRSLEEYLVLVKKKGQEEKNKQCKTA